MHPAPLPPDGLELAGLLSALTAQRHPAVARFTTAQDALEFLLDDCTIAVFHRYLEHEGADLCTVLMMVMDQGPQFVSMARLEPGAQSWLLSHTTLDDFAPYEVPSRHPYRQPQVPASHSAEPRAPDAGDLSDFLRMFRTVNDPFLMDQLGSDSARLEYLRDRARIAIFDHCKSGDYQGPLAFFLWPSGSRFVMVAIKTSARWRFASSEVSES